MRQARRCAQQLAPWKRKVIIGLLCGVLHTVGGGQVAPLHAQTTNITSSGLNTTIHAVNPTTIAIDGGTRPGGGPNLFHSFGQFSIGEGHTALFRNSDAGATSNIFGRVTGNSISNIFGTIDTATNFPTANLWLINPSGFLFGPTAALNVGGSVNISTADYLRMADGNKFFVDPAKNSVLSMEPVAAFGFTAPQPITIQGSALVVAAGKSLSIVGGDLEITGRFNAATNTPEGFLVAPSGRIQLVSVGSPGEVLIGTTNTGVPDLKVDTFSQLGNITLSKVAILNASGDPGGTVQIRAGSLAMDRAFIATNTIGNVNGVPVAVDLNVAGRVLIQNGLGINSVAMAGGRSGDIRINSGTLDVTSAAMIRSEANGGGRGGDIRINSGTLNVTSTAKIFSSTTGNGNAGDVSIKASAITLADPISQISSTVVEQQVGNGHAGSIVIEAKTVDVTNGAGINNLTSGKGNAGAVSIAAMEAVRVRGQGRREDKNVVSTIVSSTQGTGSGGMIAIKAPLIAITDRGQIDSSTIARLGGRAGDVTLDGGKVTIDSGGKVMSSTVGNMPGGTVTIQAADSLTVAGKGLIAADTLGDGDAGQIRVVTPVLHLQRSDILTSTHASGNGGSITVEANQISLRDGALISSGRLTDGTGNAGGVTLQATGLFSSQASTVSSEAKTGAGGNVSITAGNVQLADGTTILAKTTGSKNAGSITLMSASDIQVKNSTITTSADQASGGNIKLTAPNAISLFNSQLTSSVQGQVGSNGGNISIDPVAVSIQNSQLLANASAGAGGNINVVASGAVLVSPSSVLDASAGPAGVPGRVNINSPIQVLGGTLVPLKVSYSQPALSGDRCAADPQGRFSSFVQTGRDGVPPIPGAYAPSPLVVLDQLVSSARSAQPMNLTARRLGLDSVGTSSFQFQSACRS